MAEFVKYRERGGGLIVVMMAAMLLFSACGGKESEGKAETSTEEITLTDVMDLDSTTIARFCEEGSPAILEFGGHRCVSCMQMKSNFDELRERYPNLRVGYVYWEDSPRLFEQWKIGLIPAQVVLDADGKEVARHTGVWKTEEIEEAIRDLVDIER